MLATLLILSQLANPPAALPEAVQKDIDYAGEMCHALGEIFKFSPKFIEQADFNQDGQPDYVLDARGFECGRQTKNLFHNAAGQPLYLYLSGDDGWKKSFNAYVYEFRIKQVYGEAPQFDVWVRGEVGYQTNFVRYQWNGEEMAVMEQKMNAEIPKQLWKNFD